MRDHQWPQGVDVAQVPDMVGESGCDLTVRCNDGCMTFYYTNQQSARLMFYHDHSWGITRLNVYAGEAAGYVITDATEQKLLAPGGAMAGLGVGIPLVIQDRTFVPDAAQLGCSRTPPGILPAGAATATCGITTSTCPPRTPVTRAV